jgi:hypothetical protein
MNIERLHLLKAQILAEPQHYEQHTWGGVYADVEEELLETDKGSLLDMFRLRLKLDGLTSTENSPLFPTAEKPLCGTACCMAGTAYAMFDFSSFLSELDLGHGLGNSVYAARLLLDLTDSEAGFLFSLPYGWPAPFNMHYQAATTPFAAATVGAAVIDYLIAHPGLSHAEYFGWDLDTAIKECDEEIPF